MHTMIQFAFAALALSLAVPAAACSWTSSVSEADRFASAPSIFRARVTEARLATYVDPLGAPNSTVQVEVVEARFEVKEVFKGTPPASGIVRDLPFGPGNCSLGLFPGMECVFYPDKHDMVLLYSGSFCYFIGDRGEARARLDALRRLAEQVRH